MLHPMCLYKLVPYNPIAIASPLEKKRRTASLLKTKQSIRRVQNREKQEEGRQQMHYDRRYDDTSKCQR